jgi:hypothetical protein
VAHHDSLARERGKLRLQRSQPLVRLRVVRIRQLREADVLATLAEPGRQPRLPVTGTRTLEPVQDEE